MAETKQKLKRRYEILGMVADSGATKRLTFDDFAEIYDVESLTIKRDLEELRRNGVQINSVKKKGVTLTGPIDDDTLTNSILFYLGLNYTSNIFDRATTLLIKRFGNRALTNVVTIQRAIDSFKKLKIEYLDNELESVSKTAILLPLMIFHSTGSWRVLCQAENNFKQYHLSKIASMITLDETFVPVSKERLDLMFNTSWSSWLSEDIFEVKLLLDKSMGKRMTDRPWIPTQKIELLDTGDYLFECKVNSLEEITTWIAGHGKSVLVLEPTELKEKVIKKAKETLARYSNP